MDATPAESEALTRITRVSPLPPYNYNYNYTYETGDETDGSNTNTYTNSERIFSTHQTPIRVSLSRAQLAELERLQEEEEQQPTRDQLELLQQMRRQHSNKYKNNFDSNGYNYNRQTAIDSDSESERSDSKSQDIYKNRNKKRAHRIKNSKNNRLMVGTKQNQNFRIKNSVLSNDDIESSIILNIENEDSNANETENDRPLLLARHTSFKLRQSGVGALFVNDGEAYWGHVNKYVNNSEVISANASYQNRMYIVNK